MKWGYLCIFNSAELVLELYVLSIMRIYCLTGVKYFFLHGLISLGKKV